MNRQSYLDTMNAGRRRRSSSSLEELSQTLEDLESRIGRTYGEGREARHGDRRMPPRADLRQPLQQEVPAAVVDELNALRAELRHQMGFGLRKEFEALKSEIDRTVRNAAPQAHLVELGAEFDRLSAMIDKLSRQHDDRHINVLRLEMEEVKSALGKLAREETVQSFDRRWDELDRRWSEIASQLTGGPAADDDGALRALAARLDQITAAVEALPGAMSLRALEENMKLLAASVDQLAHSRDRAGDLTLGVIDERLDEITRALAVSKASPAATHDPEPFERLEARLSTLSRQVTELVEEDMVRGLTAQLATLSHRVEDIAHRIDMPEQATGRLAAQIEDIARKLDQAPAVQGLDGVLAGLDSRFASLAESLEQRHTDAIAKGRNLFLDLERRLDDIALGLASGGGDALRGLESRLGAITDRLEVSTSRPAPASIDTELVRSLEAQIAALTSHLAAPSASAPAADLIVPRLEQIEQKIEAGKQDIFEAARRAAEEAISGFSGSSRDGAVVAGLVDDLKSLETLTRRSDDRNARTFEAIHDTLLKIVDRLGSMEETASGRIGAAPFRETLDEMRTPSLEPTADALPMAEEDDEEELIQPRGPARPNNRSAATAAAEAAADAIRTDAETVAGEDAPAKRSMLGGLARRLSSRKAKQKEEPAAAVAEVEALADEQLAPSVELDDEIDPRTLNQPLEPGSGAPDLNAIMRRVRDERQASRPQNSDTAKADFIAAARRAAQAAAAEAEVLKRGPVQKSKASGFSLGAMLKSSRKPMLMGVAAILMALAALQAGQSYLGGSSAPVAEAPAPAPLVAQMQEPAPEPAQLAAETPAPVTAAAAPAEPSPASPPSAGTATADWLENADTIPEVATATPLSPAAEPVEAEQADLGVPEGEVVPEASEDALAAIPVDAGPAALREAAAAGDPKAFYEIGTRYAEGQGTAGDLAKAADWYERAAEEGLAPAQYRIGNLYEKGIGVERDIAKAKTWYQLAAAQGNASAMHNLAVLFAMGADGTADNDSAVRWFQEAADHGVRDSQFNLGILAAKGVGMKQDLEAAYKWLAIVAEAGDKDAAAKRDEVASLLTPEQLENARAAAELWKVRPLDEEANTVEVPDSWRESGETTASVDMKQAVRNIQHILNKNGYQAGSEDGVMGRKTTQALAAFQKDNGLEPTGAVDEAVVRALLARR